MEINKDRITINQNAITLNLNEFPPSVNLCYGFNGSMRFKTKRYKDYEERVHALFPEKWTERQNDGITDIKKEVKPFDEPVKITIIVTMDDQRIRDLGNMQKVLLDVLVGKAIKDDNWKIVRRLEFRAVEGTKKKISIEIKKITRKERILKCADCGAECKKDDMCWDMALNCFVCERCF